MCFSAEASFVASAGLAVIGASTLNRTKGEYKLIGAIPFLFAIQQFVEGIQWISTPYSLLSQLLAYAFVFFAFLVWPVYIPLVVFIIDKKRRDITRWFLLIGISTAIFLLIGLFTNPLDVLVLENINYRIDIPYDWFVVAGYFLAVCGTPIASSKPGFRLLGITALASAAIAGIIFYYSFVSVWCFLAAVISGLIYLYARSDKTHHVLKPFDKVA